MADNYLQFSEVLANLTETEEAWLKKQLQPIGLFGDEEYPLDEDNHPVGIPDTLAGQEPDWFGARFLRDDKDYDPDYGCLDFDYNFHDDPDKGGWGRHVWVYAEEFGNPENLVCLVQKFLKKFRPDQCWGLTFAATCLRPRVGEFGGGAVFVTANRISWQNAHDFVQRKRAAFETKQKVCPTKKGKKL